MSGDFLPLGFGVETEEGQEAPSELRRLKIAEAVELDRESQKAWTSLLEHFVDEPITVQDESEAIKAVAERFLIALRQDGEQIGKKKELLKAVASGLPPALRFAIYHSWCESYFEESSPSVYHSLVSTAENVERISGSSKGLGELFSDRSPLRLQRKSRKSTRGVQKPQSIRKLLLSPPSFTSPRTRRLSQETAASLLVSPPRVMSNSSSPSTSSPLQLAMDSEESGRVLSMWEQIDKDLDRTFPFNTAFQKSPQTKRRLRRLLLALSLQEPDVGYCQVTVKN